MVLRKCRWLGPHRDGARLVNGALLGDGHPAEEFEEEAEAQLCELRHRQHAGPEEEPHLPSDGSCKECCCCCQRGLLSANWVSSEHGGAE